MTTAASVAHGPHTASGSASPPALPLAGVRVLELGSLIAGPFAGRLLADFGAEVIKIEDPSRPDPLRDWGNARVSGRGLWWSVQSRNKTLVTLDLRTGRGRELLLDLAAEADVLLENFRPGTLERWGIGPDVLWQRNRGLIVTRVSGFGQDGPATHRPGYASVAEAMGGLRHLNGFPGMAPPRFGISLGDSLGALYAVQGTLTALYWRDARGGTGQVVDVSLVESCFSLLEGAVPEYAATGTIRGPSGTGLRGIAPSNLFETADGKWLVIAANQDTVFGRLADAMGEPALATDPRFDTHEARGRNQIELEEIVARWAESLPWEKLTDLLDEAGVPCGPVYTIADVVADPLFQARDMLVETADDAIGPVVHPGLVPKLTASPGAIRWSGRWEPGRDNAEVYGSVLGLGPQELTALSEEGVI